MTTTTSAIIPLPAGNHASLCAVIAAAVMLSGAALAQDAGIVPPTNPAPRASVTIADFRYGDILWENDRTAHRIYGRLLEAVEAPSGSGIDVWGKSVGWPFMERQLRTGDQHADHGDGLDFYNVGIFRGAGGLGVWQDNKLWVSRNYAAVRILNNGPKNARFEVDYAPWPVNIERKVWETRRFDLPLGTNFTRMTSTICSDTRGPMLVGIGISRNPTGAGNATYTVDRARGRIVWWGPDVPGKGSIGVTLMVDPAMIADVRDDANDHLVLLRVMPGKPFVYYMGAAWSKGPHFADAAAWQAYVVAQNPDFDPAR